MISNDTTRYIRGDLSPAAHISESQRASHCQLIVPTFESRVTAYFTRDIMGEEQDVVRVPTADNSIEETKADAIELSSDGVVIDRGLHRALKGRHLQMMALGGVIG